MKMANETSISKEMKLRLKAESYFALSLIIFAAIMLMFFMPESKYHEGTIQHTYAKYTYYACIGVTVALLAKLKLLKDGIIGG
jgi:hypothetical protein